MTQRRADLFAALLSILAVLSSLVVADRVYENMPHIEDEIAFVWQARVIAQGELSAPTPHHARQFLVPFVVDHHGERFGKYPLGWPVLLSFGIRLGLREWVNPLLAGLGVWLTYLLGKRLLSEVVGLVAALLTVTSPFFLLNSGSLLSHPMGLVLITIFILAWMETFGSRDDNPKSWVRLFTAAITLGLMALTRPLTAFAVALPFGAHGLYLLLRGTARVRWQLLVFILVVFILSSLHFVWQYAVTGDPFTNPYSLWWEYDKIGFGPGIGVMDGGHSPHLAYLNTRFSLKVGMSDLFGWGIFSWIFLPFGIWVVHRKVAGWLLIGIPISLVLLYNLYWVGAWLYGPRYYFEGLQALTVISAAGIAGLASWPLGSATRVETSPGGIQMRPLLATFFLSLLILANLIFYLPQRLSGMNGLHGFNRTRLQPFLTEDAQALAPALMIVHPEYWTAYGTLLELQDPFLNSPFVFTLSAGPAGDAVLANAYQDRTVFHYYPEEPYIFYTSRKPD